MIRIYSAVVNFLDKDGVVIESDRKVYHRRPVIAVNAKGLFGAWWKSLRKGERDEYKQSNPYVVLATSIGKVLKRVR